MKLHGLKKAASATKDICSKDGYGWRVTIYLNMMTGEITTWEHPDGNSWQFIKNPNVQFVVDARYPMTMREIADIIKDRFEYVKELKGE